MSHPLGKIGGMRYTVPKLAERLQTEADAYLFMEELRWGDGEPLCPAGSTGRRKKPGKLLRWFHDPRVLRGRSLRLAAIRARSPASWTARSVPFGRYWRRRPLVFSFEPRCQGLCGSQK